MAEDLENRIGQEVVNRGGNAGRLESASGTELSELLEIGHPDYNILVTQTRKALTDSNKIQRDATAGLLLNKKIGPHRILGGDGNEEGLYLIVRIGRTISSIKVSDNPQEGNIHRFSKYGLRNSAAKAPLPALQKPKPLSTEQMWEGFNYLHDASAFGGLVGVFEQSGISAEDSRATIMRNTSLISSPDYDRFRLDHDFHSHDLRIDSSTYSSRGSGFLITQNGFVVTNRHVAEPMFKTDYIDGQPMGKAVLKDVFGNIYEIDGRFYLTHKSWDVALLKVKKNGNPEPERFLSGSVEKGMVINVYLDWKYGEQKIATGLYPIDDVILDRKHKENTVAKAYQQGSICIGLRADRGQSGSPIMTKEGVFVGLVYQGSKDFQTNNFLPCSLTEPTAKLSEMVNFCIENKSDFNLK